MSRRELMHSNFIAWALDSESSHALRFYPIYQLVRAISIIQDYADNIAAQKLASSLVYKFFDDDFIKKTANQRRSKSLTGIKHPKGINHSNYDKSVPTGKKLYKEYLEGNTQEQLAEKYNTNQATISSRICEYKKTIPQP